MTLKSMKSSTAIARAISDTFLNNPIVQIKDPCVSEEFVIKLLEEAIERGSGDLLNQVRVSRLEGINGPMRHLYLISKGNINRKLNAVHAANRPIMYSDFDHFTKLMSRIILAQLSRCGYAQSFGLVPELLINKLSDIALAISIQSNTSRGVINTQDSLKHIEVKKFLANPILWLVAEQYLKCRPILNDIQIWRTVPFNEKYHNLSADALMWHFDHDYNRFLKVFICLNDVTTLNGPHTCLPNTSFTRLPAFVNHDGRYTDRMIDISGLKKWMHTGNKGTVIFGDTLNLHKGLPCINGERLMMQIQFVDSCSFSHNPYYEDCYEYQISIKR